MTSVDALVAFLTDLRAKADAATPGPWRVVGDAFVCAGEIRGSVSVSDWNADFIAALPPELVRLLCDVVEAAGKHLCVRGPPCEVCESLDRLREYVSKEDV